MDQDPEKIFELANERKKKRNQTIKLSKSMVNNVFSYLDIQVKNQEMNLATDEKKILMIYTGGTIGMAQSDKGLVPKKNFMQKLIKSNRYLCDSDYTYFNSKDDFLITPISIYKQRIWYRIEEFEEIKDSSTLDAEDWIQIATEIEKNYDIYDSFIILHGTDTMAFTASALSFMLENLKKTVVVTGSQVPLGEMRNDAFDNILGALTVAEIGHYNIPEVCVFFKDKLFRGNRTTKVDAFGLDAFSSPNFPPLGTFGLIFVPDWNLIRKSNQKKFQVNKKLSKKIGILKFFPSIQEPVIRSVLESDIQGCIIEAYGAGNLPVNRKDVREALTDAAKAGKKMVVRTQCAKGSVNALYAIGRELMELGLVSGLDMTIECAITKMAYLFGNNVAHDDFNKMMIQDLRGEVTDIIKPTFSGNQDNFIKAISDTMKISTEYDGLKEALYPTILCYAADFGYISVLEEMKKIGANFDSGDYEGRTPLHVAAKKGQTEVINYLIEQRVDLDNLDVKGQSSLFVAIVSKQYGAAKALIRAGAKIIAEDEDIGDYLFKMAAKGDIEGIKFIFYSGVKILQKFTNIDGRTIGHIAVSENQTKIIEFLKEDAQFNFNTKDRWGRTPQDEAVEQGNMVIMKLLGVEKKPEKEKLHKEETVSRKALLKLNQVDSQSEDELISPFAPNKK